MRIDRTHRRWAVSTAAVLLLAVALYIPAAFRPTPPAGGSFQGLAFGIAGFGLMLYAGLLGARRKVRVWRLGRAQTWMRGHLWLGLLSLPIVLLHSGLSFGAGLTSVLMWLLLVVVLSGLAGAWLQHTMPRRLLREVPMETIFEQIDRVRVQLLSEADTVVAEACGKLEIEAVPPSRVVTTRRDATAMLEQGRSAAAAALATTARNGAEESSHLREFYTTEVRPFIERPAAGHPLAGAAFSGGRFAKVRALVPPELHPAIADLENICEEERQLIRQARLHRILHGWLLVHVPLSLALLALAVIHIVVALRY
jgi:hypothetical protein